MCVNLSCYAHLWKRAQKHETNQGNAFLKELKSILIYLTLFCHFRFPIIQYHTSPSQFQIMLLKVISNIDIQSSSACWASKNNGLAWIRIHLFSCLVIVTEIFSIKTQKGTNLDVLANPLLLIFGTTILISLECANLERRSRFFVI